MFENAFKYVDDILHKISIPNGMAVVSCNRCLSVSRFYDGVRESDDKPPPDPIGVFQGSGGGSEGARPVPSH